MMEETIQEEIIAGEESSLLIGVAEESGIQEIGNDTVLHTEIDVMAEGDEQLTADLDVEEGAEVARNEVTKEPTKQPAKRGRKRKSDATAPPQTETEAPEPRKRGRKPLEKKDKNSAAMPKAHPVPARRSKRVSDITEQEPSILEDSSAGAMEEAIIPPVVAKPRGRPPKATAQSGMPPPAKKQKRQEKELEKEIEEPVFKKPKAAPKAKKKTGQEGESQLTEGSIENGKLVDMYGKPISKSDLDQMSTTTTGTRFGRGRHLSVFRELEPDSAATVGRTGRHRVKPINFWANEMVSYDPTGNMQSIVNRVFEEPPLRRQKKSGRSKGSKKSLSAIGEEAAEEEVEVQPWEEEGEGEFVGPYRGYDAANKVSTNKLINTSKLFSILLLR